MKRRYFNKLISASALTSLPIMGTADSKSWSLVANIAECCSCDIPCPCNFGRSTKFKCDGTRLIEISQGYIDGSNLAGIKFIVTFEMGKWSRIYADNEMNQNQINGFNQILPLAFKGFAKQAKSIEKTSLMVEHGRNLIKFSSPQSEIEMKPLLGMDGGLIKIDGLPYKTFYNYIQYESVKHNHSSLGTKWSHSGTNGFTSKMIASG